MTRRALGITLAAAALLMLTSTAYFFHFYYSPLSSSNTTITFNLAPGSSVYLTVKHLQKEGVFTPLQAQLFKIWIKAKNVQKSLQAGEYAFSLSITPKLLLTKFLKGEVVQHSITLPEGITFTQAVNIIRAHPSIKHTEEGQSLPIAEGWLFPDTYFFTANTTDVAFLRRAQLRMEQKLAKAWEARDPDIILKSPMEALILASIIEKETALLSEKALISGVFQRRLSKKMRLQADPTVIYGLAGQFSGPLTKALLKQDNIYNTYMHLGLPPTPIALPGLSSIEAACHPDKGDALYFVAKGNGSHYFSLTLKEHNKAVEKFQRGMQ